MKGMGGIARTDEERHFSGVNTRIVVQFLKGQFGPDVVATVLERAGESRPEEVLCDDAGWSSYGQVRRLFEATSAVLGGPEALTDAALATPIVSASSAETAQALQDVGSPDSLLEATLNSDSSLGLSTIRNRDGEQVAPGEWLIREWFVEGFEPFPEFCAFEAGVQTLVPRLFGLPFGEVTEETCCCRGDDRCTFRLRWSQDGDAEHGPGYFETRSQMLESRLHTFQRTIADLVAAQDPDAALSRVIESASRAVYAPSYVLVTDPDLPIRPRLLYRGLEPPEAQQIGSELLTDAGRDAPGRLCVQVASNRSRYGWFAAVDAGPRHFLPTECELITSYAGLAAAALDAAASNEEVARALEEARRQAATSATLLELATDLAGLSSPEDMAGRLAEAVRRVVDCDNSIVMVRGEDGVEIAAVVGFPERIEAQLLERRLPDAALAFLGSELTYLDARAAAELCGVYELPSDPIAVATALAPMVVNGQIMGALVVSVMERPERLLGNDGLSDELRGIAGQGATALGNAHLLGQIRHQALHDGLTGLGNRTLMIERLEQALERARREGEGVAAMFIDLDGFKEINDSLGHAAGDALLSEIGTRLQGVLRARDSVGRIGGDEFVVVLEGKSLVAGAEVIADRVLNEIRRPFQLSGVDPCRLSVTASIGIAVGDRRSADDILRDADLALYRAKAAGKDRCIVYSANPTAVAESPTQPVPTA